MIILFGFSAVRSQNYKQVQIYLKSKHDTRELSELGLAIDHASYQKDNSIIVFLSDDEFELLKTSDYSYKILIDNWRDHYYNLPRLTDVEKTAALQETRNKFNITGFDFGSMGGYYTLEEVWAKLDEMHTNYPNLITVKTILGTSLEGRNIYAVKISDNPGIDEDEPKVLYTALHHAREPEGMMQMIYFMFYLLNNYGNDPAVTYLLDNRELFFIPVVNADGYRYNQTTDPNGGGMWRKNRRNNGNGTYGVDLNRNYGPYEYWNAPNGGSSDNSGSEVYRGTAPFSEPETQTVRNFLYSRNIKNCLNYHTYGNLLIYPYGALEIETPDSIIFREYSRDMTQFNRYVYGTDQQTVGYSTRGNSDDYMYDGEMDLKGKIYSMTPEVGSYLDGFWPPESRILPLAEENIYPNLYYAWVAGGYVNLAANIFSEQFIDPGDNVIFTPVMKNKGLATAKDVMISITSLSPYLSVTENLIYIDSIGSQTVITAPGSFGFSVSLEAPIGEVQKLVLSTSLSSVPMASDTLSIVIGTPSLVFIDPADNLAVNWNVSSNVSRNWEVTGSTFYSSPSSFTDSKTGNYLGNARVTMIQKNSMDLTSVNSPRLSFWTKFDIESEWDCGQIFISTNNGVQWIPLAGRLTHPGSGVGTQPQDEPVYDGHRVQWELEDIDLAQYSSNSIKLKFELRSDSWVEGDGWYVDDIKIYYYGPVPVELSGFEAVPLEKSVKISWTTLSETNNLGFEIQRSKDKHEWQMFRFKKGKGTSTEIQQYSILDDNPIAGKSYYRLVQVDYDGTRRTYEPAEIVFTGFYKFTLGQNYPNPFNPSTKIYYTLEQSDWVTLKVFNLLGEEIAVLVDAFQEAGEYSVGFSLSQLNKIAASGIYLYTLRSGSFIKTRKMIILR